MNTSIAMHVVRTAMAAAAACAASSASADPDDAAPEQQQVEFRIPAQRADKALTAFARQAGVSALFPFDRVSVVTANELVGAHELDEALEILLAGTGLDASLENGVRLVIRAPPPDQPREVEKPRKSLRSTLAAALRGRDGPVRSVHARRAPEEIVVTGSRIRRDDFSSAQPTTVIGSQTLDDLHIVNVGDAMALLPYNLGSFGPTAKPGGNESYPLNVFNGLYLANLRGLNPAYGSRTLTLVDSRRHVPTNQGDGVDLNLIPSVLVERLEVVTGGASASYGSGAIGGVVNVLLNRELDGTIAKIDFGVTGDGDGDDGHYAFAWGGAVGDSSRLVIAAERQDMDAIHDCIETREWCARGAEIQLNRDYAVNAEPNFVYRERVRRDMTTTGVMPLLNVTFDETGSRVLPYTRADEYNVGGDGQHVYLDTTLRSNVQRRVGSASFDHTFDSGLHFFVDGSVGTVESFTPQDGIDLYWTLLAPDNFYLNRLDVNPCTAAPANCRISKDFSAESNSANDTRSELKRLTSGLGGRFAGSSWTWDAYYQRGESSMLQAVYDSRHADRMLFALDAVDDGSGNPVCRVVRDGIAADYAGDPRLAEGCVPIDIFGLGNITPDAFDYAFGRILERTDIEQNVVELVSSGDVFRGFGSGPVRAAAGVSWRKETLDNIADPTQPDYVRTDYNSQFGETFGGDVEVWEYFGELDVPVTDKFGLQLAARRSEYRSTAGIGTGISGQTFDYDIDTWKLNGTWAVSDWLSVRASESRDIRAPNFRELYYRKVFPKGSNFGYCDNPWSGNRFVAYYTHTGDPCFVELLGEHTLTPEEAGTTTFGVVVTPPGAELRLAVDHYRIRIADAISPANIGLMMDGCFVLEDPFFCSQIEGTLLDPQNPVGGFSKIDRISPRAMNIRAYESSGIDVSADWAHAFRFGQLSSRLMASGMIEQLVQPSSTSPQMIDISGVTGDPGEGADWESAPDWTVHWITSFRRDRFSVTAKARYLSAGKKHATRIGPQDHGFDPDAPDSIDDNRVPSYVLWSLAGAYDFDVRGARIRVFGDVQNLFDEPPPLTGAGVGGTNPVLFDTIGRAVRIGVQLDF